MTPRPMPDTIETLRLTLQRLEQTTDPARDSAHLAAIKRVLLNIIAELEIAQALESSAPNTATDAAATDAAATAPDSAALIPPPTVTEEAGAQQVTGTSTSNPIDVELAS